jgi:hypothetical protein
MAKNNSGSRYFQDPCTGVDMVLRDNGTSVVVEVSPAVGPFPTSAIRESESTAADMTLDIECEGLAHDLDGAARMLRSRGVDL